MRMDNDKITKMLTKEIGWFITEQIMLMEYRKEESSFMKYFNLLETAQQQSLVERIRRYDQKEQNLGINVHLFNRGFKEVYLGFFELYYKNPEGLVRYMRSCSNRERDDIIRHLINIEERNEAADRLVIEAFNDDIERVGSWMIPKPGEEG